MFLFILDLPISRKWVNIDKKKDENKSLDNYSSRYVVIHQWSLSSF